MKKLIILCFVLSGTFIQLNAQDFNSAVGLRFGIPTSLSYKTFLSSNGAAEGIVGFRSLALSSYFTVGAAYQLHNDIDSVDGLQWYYGAGASLNFWSYDAAFVEEQVSLGLGVSGYLGLSYTFSDIPLNLSVDWVPTILLGGSGFNPGYGALAARYIMN